MLQRLVLPAHHSVPLQLIHDTFYESSVPINKPPYRYFGAVTCGMGATAANMMGDEVSTKSKRDTIRCAAAAMIGAGALTLFHTVRKDHKKVPGYATAGVHLTVGTAMLLDSTVMCRTKAKKATKPAPKK